MKYPENICIHYLNYMFTFYRFILKQPVFYSFHYNVETRNSRPYGLFFLAPAVGWEPFGLPTGGPFGPPSSMHFLDPPKMRQSKFVDPKQVWTIRRNPRL